MEDYTKAAKEEETGKRQRFEHYFSRYSNHLNSLEVTVAHKQCFLSVVTELALTTFLYGKNFSRHLNVWL